MVYIIQTNTLIDNENNPRDFQSIMFKYSSWEDYKHDFTNEEVQSSCVTGTLIGNLKPKRCEVENIIINDDFHLECIIKNDWTRMNIKAYKVNQNQFENLL